LKAALEEKDMRFAKLIVLFSWLFAAIVLPGCNAGLAGVVVALLLKDGGGGHKKKMEVKVDSEGQFQGLENARTQPAASIVRLRLVNEAGQPAGLLFELSADQGAFRPMTLQPPLPGALEPPAKLTGVPGSREGTFHRIGWNALGDVGDDSLHRVTIRITGSLKAAILGEDKVGNDPPRIEELTLSQEEGAPVTLAAVLSDSSDDPVDLDLEFTTAPEGTAGRAFQRATTIGATTGLSTTSDGIAHSFQWDAVRDLGSFDRQAFIRLTPSDRIDGVKGKTGSAVERPVALDNNRSPRAEVLEGDLLTDPDQRGGISLRVLVIDAERNPVDAIVQWTLGNAPFPALSGALDHDAGARASLLADPVARRGLKVATLLDEPLESFVEEPAAGLQLKENETLVTSIKSSFELRGLAGGSLAGRKVSLVGPAGGPPQVRRACAFDPGRGVLAVDRAFSPVAAPGSILRVDLGGSDGTLRLASSPTGVVHHFIWSGREELPGGGAVRFRVTPFDRVAAAEDDGCGEVPPADPSVSSGERGPAVEVSGTKRIRGPFLEDDAWIVPLLPVDNPSTLVTGDFDADGRVDLAYSAGSSSAVVILLQKKAGVFDPLRLLDSRVATPSGLLARDLDGDGRLDLAVSGEESGNILLIYQKPPADFFTSRTILDGDGLVRPVALSGDDLDGDGDVDLVAADAGGSGGSGAQVKVFFRGAAFGAIECGKEENGFRACVLEDPKGVRGVRALAVTKSFGVETSAAVAAGDGFFTLFTLSRAGNSAPGRDLAYGVTRVEVPGSELTSAAFSDLDKDGLLDLLFTDRAGSRIVLARQKPGGDFDLLPPVTASGLKGPVGLQAVDLDKNGVVDFAVASSGDLASHLGGNVTLFLGSPAGDLTSDSLSPVPELGRRPFAPTAVAVADVDGDGRLDVAAANGGSNDIVVFRQAGPGAFREPALVVAEEQVVPEPSSLLAADLDGDGQTDLITPNVSGEDLTFFHQEIGGIFSALRIALPSPPLLRGPAAAASGDIDGDGLADLVTANLESNDLTALLQDSGGGFKSRVREVRPLGFVGPHSLALSDIDGDGRLDLAAAARFSSDVRWFRQGNDGSFAEAAVLRPADGSGVLMQGPIQLAASDVDRDGMPDIITANQLSENVTIFFQSDPRGTFGPPVEAPLGQGTRPVALTVTDLDGDGQMDIVTASLGPSPVSILRQSSPRVFTRLTSGLPVAPATSLEPTGIQARDLDGDARIDLAVSFDSEAASLLAVYFQGESGALDGKPSLLASPLLEAPVAVVPVDLDGDGEPDIASANRLSGNVTVFYGGR
jgi:hypothetical protein